MLRKKLIEHIYSEYVLGSDKKVTDKFVICKQKSQLKKWGNY